MATLATTRPTNPVPPRKIRFAPLPDPRRAVLIADNGDELPLPDNSLSPTTLLEDNCSSSSSSSQISSSSPPPSDQGKCSPASSVGSSPITVTTSLPGKSSNPPPQNPPVASTSWLLKPFKRSPVSSSSSSSHSLTPTPSISQPPPPQRRPLSLSTEEILTLGTINLFRTSSRDSTDTTSGWSLARWASSGGDSANSSRSTLFNGSSPLARTQSNQSYKPKSTSIFPTSSSSISSGGGGRAKARINTKPPVKATNRHKGTRMLNGRVYGAPKRDPNANPFANARDEEPEFVEWGYGGMGSVKGARSAGVGGGGGVNWERLHGGSVAKESEKAAPDAEEEDDGSGMAWLKKRREERERKAKEEKEKAEKGKQNVEAGEGGGDESKANTPTPTRRSTLTELSVISSTPTTVEPPPPDTADEQEEIKKPEQDVPAPLETPSTPTHVLEAVTIPMRPRHGHSHSHSFSKITPLVSPGLAPNQSTVASPDSGDSSPGVPLSMRAPSTATLTPANASVDGTKSPVTSTPKRDSISSLSSASSTSSDEEGDDDDESDDEDEDEEEDEMRKTSLCAGIEKISRHKE